MSEKLNFPEKGPVTEQEVVNILEERGIEDPEAKAMFDRYAEQCEQAASDLADSHPDSAGWSNWANAEAAFKIAWVLLKTVRYKQEGIDGVSEAMYMALQELPKEKEGEMRARMAEQNKLN